jgi:hypothetical protein
MLLQFGRLGATIYLTSRPSSKAMLGKAATEVTAGGGKHRAIMRHDAGHNELAERVMWYAYGLADFDARAISDDRVEFADDTLAPPVLMMSLRRPNQNRRTALSAYPLSAVHQCLAIRETRRYLVQKAGQRERAQSRLLRKLFAVDDRSRQFKYRAGATLGSSRRGNRAAAAAQYGNSTSLSEVTTF